MQQFLYRIYSGRKYLQQLFLSLVLMLLAMQSFATPANATGVYDIPSVVAGEKTWILDQAEVLSRISEGQINNILDNLAKQTGNEVRFVTIHRLDYEETAQSFTDRLFEKWFPTPETQANQILLAIDTVTNTTGIRTGEKVKSLMSDEIAQSVAQETVLVPLRQGDKYNQAFIDASDRISAVLSGKPDPGAPVVINNEQVESTFKKAEETDTGGSTVWVIGLLIAATVIPMATYYWYQSMGS
ncbi:beta-propeller domain-containing protein, methanol dehydrogenase [[Phormidium ambiguum] IAM M-71]|uniref:Beta-propeller domain-containing protein, methanol dehydrogenase n=1 Tax=[Phormidium ambiguum] IAM M-71 TaxID=454136 RepID=A0A1U7IQ95_9CYAN|nr:TPM domain-containing protein [Phormidium ambiguum]OKH39607.1 beta-propeller domain-containing protein, methanol dehydrogenase [Phormidium ambiguum IAM M-71]